ncbi:uncharacterized protein BHQ10_001023 [Talaromyces amestolkiae]|uniref:DEUBAD domain-containing protein n=1 Tax=Talaromyces amestolkiae TaxID=1196081 RepID=A0A364KNC3_TALAM|nr:uncharacterized protein BHQ10_001023 [Talaromyces amestolkiae]RAO65011.1 hypothetical protein BHQ10_001023 [Talaromyces amestolkiae]
MPPKRKAVSAADVKSDGPPTRTSKRIRDKQLQAAAKLVSDAGHLETKAMSSAPKQNAARKRGPWGEDYLMTSTKSALAHADLVRLFSNPKAWECLEEDEKRELLSLLPAHIHPNPDPDPNDPEAKIPPLPETFLRYDNNWRAALRNFQSDLESGRYRPDWQRQAKQAVQERAQGKFDDYKEQEFEQFWGQKQKINHGLIAGESSKVKLETLIAHDVVRVGDVWKYCRVFGGKKAQILVEKEVKITAIDGAKLSFLMPTGQRVFLSAGSDLKSADGKIENERERSAGEGTEDIKTEGKIVGFERIENSISDGKTENADEVKDNTQMDIDLHPASQPGEDPPSQALDEHTQGHASTQYNLKGLLDYALPSVEATAEGEKDKIDSKESKPTAHQQEAPESPVAEVGIRRKRGRPAKRKSPHDEVQHTPIEVNGATEIEAAGLSKEDVEEPAAITENGVNADPLQESAPEQEHKNADSSQQSTTPTTANLRETALSPKFEESESAQCSATATPLEVEIHDIAGPNALMKKILETDGRVKNPPNGNAWKEIRCYRNNQDMGSLWEVRQAWYVKYQQD